MPESIRAKEPFRFYTRLHLAELTGLRAVTISQLLSLIEKVPGSCIYYHTHSFLQQHQYLSPEPSNDFAYWVSEILREDELGERLASIDTIQFSTIRSLRDTIISTIDDYLKANPLAKLRFARDEEAFHFIKSVSFVLPTEYVACDLIEFVDVLKKVAIDSIYYHIFEGRLRYQRNTNDFSNWIELSMSNKKIADEILRLDPYTYTLEDLRKILIRILERDIDN